MTLLDSSDEPWSVFSSGFGKVKASFKSFTICLVCFKFKILFQGNKSFFFCRIDASLVLPSLCLSQPLSDLRLFLPWLLWVIAIMSWIPNAAPLCSIKPAIVFEIWGITTVSGKPLTIFLKWGSCHSWNAVTYNGSWPVRLKKSLWQSHTHERGRLMDLTVLKTEALHSHLSH